MLLGLIFLGWKRGDIRQSVVIHAEEMLVHRILQIQEGGFQNQSLLYQYAGIVANLGQGIHISRKYRYNFCLRSEYVRRTERV
jgi:hypothetical protein